MAQPARRRGREGEDEAGVTGRVSLAGGWRPCWRGGRQCEPRRAPWGCQTWAQAFKAACVRCSHASAVPTALQPLRGFLVTARSSVVGCDLVAVTPVHLGRSLSTQDVSPGWGDIDVFRDRRSLGDLVDATALLAWAPGLHRFIAQVHLPCPLPSRANESVAHSRMQGAAQTTTSQGSGINSGCSA